MMVFFAFEQLPTEIQEYIEQGQQIDIVKQGKTIATIPTAQQKPSYAKGDFDYDLERMKYMMDTEFVEMPKGTAKDLDSFEKWLVGAFK